MKKVIGKAIMAAGVFALILSAQAQNGTWTNLNDSVWSASTNWLNGTVADGSGATADFSTVDQLSTRTIILDSSRTNGNLIFADTDTNTAAGWILTTNIPGGQTLTLAGSAPTITVNDLAPGNVAEIRTPLAGTNGLIKTGPGELQLTGPTPTLTGGIVINGGNLRAASVGVQTVTNSATLTLTSSSAFLGSSTVSGMYVPAGTTGNLVDVATGSHFYNGVSGGAGSTLNILCQGNGMTFSSDRNWAWFGSLGTVNVSAEAGERWNWRLRSNGGAFDGNSFQNTTVNMDSVTTFLNTFSSGADCRFGALNGTTNAILNGGAAGSRARYIIGQLNTDSLWEGVMGTGNGFTLQKEGTGHLTLSGTNINYQPTSNATAARRGGETIINAGVLALTNGASINRGIVSAGTEYFSIITVNPSGTYDLVGTTNNTTAPLTILQGTGTIVGDYVHDEAVLSPGGDLAAGTLTFLNNLTITNNPSIDPTTLAPFALVTSNSTLRFDISPSLTSGNDRINVAGQAFVDGNPNLEVNFLGGASAGAYTLIYATNGIVGDPSTWVVKWGGRGAAPTITATPNAVQLNVSLGSAGNLVWKGGISGIWDVNTTSNWFNGTTDDRFFQLDNVRLDDSLGASLQPSLTLGTIVTPASVVVSNDIAVNPTYAISGSGQIGGGTSLDKRGNGTLTLTTVNTYAGGTTNSGGGILDIAGVASALGAGPLTMNGATFQTTGNNVTINTPMDFTANTTNTLQANGANSLTTFGGNFTGSSSARMMFNTDASPGQRGIDLSGTNTGFAGTIGFAGPVFLRFRTVESAGTSAIRWELGDVNTSLATVGNGTPRTFHLGYLSGGASSGLSGHASGAGGLGSDVIWEIGEQGLDMVFGGAIINGVQTGGANTTAITKVGAGKLTLTGVSTYTGPTLVSNGTLQVDGALGNTAVTVVNGATLQGGGSIAGAVSVQAGAIYSPGASVGAMTVGSLTLAGTSIMELDNAAATNSDRATVSGTLTYGGALNVVNVGGPLAVGDTFQLFLAANTTGSFSTISLPTLGGGLVWLTNRLYSEGVLQVASASAVPLIWQGDGSANVWSVGGPLNWLSDAGYSGGTPTAAAFANGLNVVIDEAGSNNVPIALSGTVQPASVTVGAAKDYTLGGSGKISGATTLLKGGVGALTIASINDYSGATTVNNGLLQVDGQLQNSAVTVTTFGDLRLNGGLVQAATIGSGTRLDGNGTVTGNLTVDAGGTLQPGVAGLGQFTVGGNLSLAGTAVMKLNTASPATNDLLQVAGTITGGGTLTVTNIGTELVNGTVFKLFSGPVSGFAAVNLPVTNVTATATYVWTDNLSTDGSITLVSGGAVNTSPFSVATTVAGNLLTLDWPSSHIGWRLQTQTNDISAGISTNWFDVDGSTNVNQFQATIDPLNPTVFFRMVYP